jgi:hypothetical protein
VYLIEEPLQLAILDLQSELRRRLGPNNHTVVEGLIDDPGCAGDVVQARLLVRFADAALTIPPRLAPYGAELARWCSVELRAEVVLGPRG